ncbi:MAG: primase alpha helix C-terminal domain-containing protein, partial [Methanoregula sp.]|nr:primase alpha helix C-terminal domain-containing protein [Methanoregula sp.]
MNVNSEQDELTAYLATLAPERRSDITQWADVPAGELKKPTEKQAAGLLKHFQKQHTTVPAGQRNQTLFKYSCCLRRCGLTESAILESLWSFTDEHCKPPHNRANSDDVSELKGLASRAFKFVKVGFPRNKKTGTDEKTRPFIIDDGRIYLSCVNEKNDYSFVHHDGEKLVFDQTYNGVFPRKLQVKDGMPVAIVGLLSRESLEETQLTTAPELYAAIDTHLKKYLDAPDIDRQLFIYYILYSWFYLKTNTAPYLRFLADTGNGKSRMQRVTG